MVNSSWILIWRVLQDWERKEHDSVIDFFDFAVSKITLRMAITLHADNLVQNNLRETRLLVFWFDSNLY